MDAPPEYPQWPVWSQMPWQLTFGMAHLNALGFWLSHITQGKVPEAVTLHGDWQGLLKS